MHRFALAAVAAFFVSIAIAATPIEVDVYQVLPEGIAVFLGKRTLTLGADILDAVPGIEAMHCQLFFRDYNLNGLPEAPAILHCLGTGGEEVSLPIETDGMENIHQET